MYSKFNYKEGSLLALVKTVDCNHGRGFELRAIEKNTC